MVFPKESIVRWDEINMKTISTAMFTIFVDSNHSRWRVPQNHLSSPIAQHGHFITDLGKKKRLLCNYSLFSATTCQAITTNTQTMCGPSVDLVMWQWLDSISINIGPFLCSNQRTTTSQFLSWTTHIHFRNLLQHKFLEGIHLKACTCLNWCFHKQTHWSHCWNYWTRH